MASWYVHCIVAMMSSESNIWNQLIFLLNCIEFSDKSHYYHSLSANHSKVVSTSTWHCDNLSIRDSCQHRCVNIKMTLLQWVIQPLCQHQTDSETMGKLTIVSTANWLCHNASKSHCVNIKLTMWLWINHTLLSRQFLCHKLFLILFDSVNLQLKKETSVRLLFREFW